MKCKFKDCKYEWKPRVEEPKACPKCKRRFDWKDKGKENG